MQLPRTTREDIDSRGHYFHDADDRLWEQIPSIGFTFICEYDSNRNFVRWVGRFPEPHAVVTSAPSTPTINVCSV